ncbi:MAG: S-layer homology domain-containing protein, partial [Clostridia bacterium]|nr:S-layer homology domain-containing protein [Clostridia bacterium]
VANYITVNVEATSDNTAGTYDWAFGTKGGKIDFASTLSNVKLTYDGTHAAFTAGAKDFPADLTVTFDSVHTYTGSEIAPTVEVKDGEYTLKKGADYQIKFENNIEVGTATMKIVGVGPYYKGTIVKTFEIAKVTFADVKADAYYAPAVLWAVEKNITNGTSATTFSPNATVTRAQAVTFLWRAAGSPAPQSTNNPFVDVKADAYYYNAVLWAVENGITKGTSATTFQPETIVTRGQAATFLFRSQKASATQMANPFTDVAKNAYYHDAALWALENGITNGTSATTFEADLNCTRGQIVTFLYRCMEK